MCGSERERGRICIMYHLRGPDIDRDWLGEHVAPSAGSALDAALVDALVTLRGTDSRVVALDWFRSRTSDISSVATSGAATRRLPQHLYVCVHVSLND